MGEIQINGERCYREEQIHQHLSVIFISRAFSEEQALAVG